MRGRGVEYRGEARFEKSVHADEVVSESGVVYGVGESNASQMSL